MALLVGEVIFLSGVGDGLGRECALLFAKHGADLIISARSPGKINMVADEVRALGRRCLPLVTDVTIVADCERATDAAFAEFGKIDTLINIAYKGAWPNVTPLLDCEPDLSNWRECFDVNVWGTLQMTRVVARKMATQQHGRIVMINSMTSEKVYEGSEAYSGSKIALQRMTRSIAMELGPSGIRVNSVHPGFMFGPQVKNVFETRARDSGSSSKEEYDKVANEIALRNPTMGTACKGCRA